MSLSIEQQGLSFIQYKVTGSESNFSFPFDYISQDNITVYLNSDTTTAFSFLSSNEIHLTTPAVTDDIITIRRFTQRSERLVDFEQGSQLTEQVLDTDSNQMFFLAQEAIDVTNFG